jgi:hypothetical protein
MRSFLRRHGETILVAVIVAALAASVPAIASTATNADKVDGFDAVGCKATKHHRAGKLVAVCANGYLPSNLIQTAPNAQKLQGFAPAQLGRSGYALSTSSTTRVGKNGKVLSTSITAPTAGFLLIHASSDNYNPKERDLIACTLVVDAVEVPSARRWFVVNGKYSDDDCDTDAVVPVTSAGTHVIDLDAIGVDSKHSTFGRTVLWALFEPFGATGAQPTPSPSPSPSP